MVLPSGNDQHSSQYSWRMNVFFFIIFLLFATLIVRLATLQFVQGDQLREQKNERMMKDVPIAPIRGNIYDRQGEVIARSTSTQSLFYRIEPNVSQDDTIRLAYRLAEIFSKLGDSKKPQMTPNDVILAMEVGYDLQKNPQESSSFRFYPRRIKSGLTNAEVAYFMENRHVLKGLEVVEESIREYDERGVAVQLVGYLRNYGIARNTKSLADYYGSERNKERNKLETFLDTEDVGYDGLELMYQDLLRGKNGLKSYPVNAKAQIIGDVEITAPEKGKNLHLTIDSRVQLATEQAILDRLKLMRSGKSGAVSSPNARGGYAVAMEVRTGKVVAMASMPDYDANIWRGGITKRERDANKFYFTNGTIASARPNFPTDEEVGRHPTSIVPLGSTIKPLTVLLGLNERLFSPNATYMDTGRFNFGKNNKASLRNAGGKKNGPIDAADSIRVSSNTFMAAMIGSRLAGRPNGVETFDRYMKAFGLGTETGSGLPNEHLGIRDYIKEAERKRVLSALVYASFGQQGKYTALQLAQFTATMANQGKRPRPLFVDKVTDADGLVVDRPKTEILNEVNAQQRYWDIVEKGMVEVTKTGSVGRMFADFPHDVAAKTGTSQSDIAGKFIENAVFIAYAPAQNPVLAVAVVMPEGGYGGVNAAPIARQIFEAYDLAIGMTGTPRKVPETDQSVSEPASQTEQRTEQP